MEGSVVLQQSTNSYFVEWIFLKSSLIVEVPKGIQKAEKFIKENKPLDNSSASDSSTSSKTSGCYQYSTVKRSLMKQVQLTE